MAIELHCFRIEGLSPILMHNGAAMQSTSASTKVGVKKIPTPEEEAAKSVYRGEDGVLQMPGAGFKSALLRSCIGKRIGKRGASVAAQAGVFEVEEFIPLYDPQTGDAIREYAIKVARVVVQRQGVLRARAMVAKWGCDVVFEIDTDFITPSQVLDLLNDAGRVAGVGDWRPERKGRFGRFKVLERKAWTMPLADAAE